MDIHHTTPCLRIEALQEIGYEPVQDGFEYMKGTGSFYKDFSLKCMVGNFERVEDYFL